MKTFVGLILMIVGFRAWPQHDPYKLVEQANEAYYSGEYAQAEVLYRKALEVLPDSAADSAHEIALHRLKGAILFNLGNAVFMQQRPEEAIRFYQQSAESAQWDSLTYYARYNKGNAHATLRQWDPAIEIYKELLRQNPHDSDTRYNLVYALLQQRRQSTQNQRQQSQKGPQQRSNSPNQQNHSSANDQQNPSKSQNQQGSKKEGNTQQKGSEGNRSEGLSPSPTHLDRRKIEQLLKAARNDEHRARRRAALQQARDAQKGRHTRSSLTSPDKDW